MNTPATYCNKCQHWFVGGCPEGHKPPTGKTPTVITKSPPAKKGGKK